MYHMLRAVISHEPGTGGTFFGTRSPEGTERSQKKSQKPSAALSCSCRQTENKDWFSICPQRMALPAQGRWQPAQPPTGTAQKQDAAAWLPPAQKFRIIFKKDVTWPHVEKYLHAEARQKKYPVCPRGLASVILVLSFKTNLRQQISKTDHDEAP